MTRATDFEKEMVEIWSKDPNGLYADWHNAVRRAEIVWSAIKLHTIEKYGQPGAIYKMSDGSRVWIHTEGYGIKAIGE